MTGGDPAAADGEPGDAGMCGVGDAGEPDSDSDDGGASDDAAGTRRGVLGAELGLVLGGAADDSVAAAASRARR